MPVPLISKLNGVAINVVLSGSPKWDIVCMYRQPLIELIYRYLLYFHRIHRRTLRTEGHWLENNVACGLKAEISELERPSIATQRLKPELILQW
jgi:hypothetical protein